jgi:putative FmdB family regulatory protein
MPLYEYECQSCHLRFERIQKFSDPLVSTCPTCGGPVQKLLSTSAFHLKGSGWYATDYRRKSEAETPAASSTTASDTASKPAAVSAADAKPAAESPSEGKSPAKTD